MISFSHGRRDVDCQAVGFLYKRLLNVELAKALSNFRMTSAEHNSRALLIYLRTARVNILLLSVSYLIFLSSSFWLYKIAIIVEQKKKTCSHMVLNLI